MSPEEDRTRDAVDSEPKHYQLSYFGRQHFIQLAHVHIDIDSRTVAVQPKPLQLLLPLIITPLYLLLTVQRAYSIINKIEGSQPEWCISSMIYSRDTPFWSETLEL